MSSLYRSIEIMDTTLRDGEQTSGVSFLPHEKLMIAKALLRELNVDRIEVASARVSDGEKLAVTKICSWADKAGYLDRVEVLGFVDKGVSLKWIADCGCTMVNLLCKGSENHCVNQLKKRPEQHWQDIRDEVALAESMGIGVNLYLEDWSNGIQDSPDYVRGMIDTLKDCNIRRYMLPDTLGVLNPLNMLMYTRKMVKLYPDIHFDFHAHNDYDLAISNVLAAVLGGCRGIHTSVNGLGERAGNAPLASVQVILKDQFDARTNIVEGQLNEVSRLVATYSGIAIPPNSPVTGENVFTQVAGVHADGDNKARLYCNALLPERFSRRREYALGKNSGRANILRNLDELGMELSPEQTEIVTRRIIELGDKKEVVTQEDLPFIVSDVLKNAQTEEKVKLVSYMVATTYEIKPMAGVKLEINGNVYEASAHGYGQFDAFMRAVSSIYTKELDRQFPQLVNYAVSIPPGGHTDALVQTVISWSWNDRDYRTRGLDADQTEAAVKATLKMLNIIENERD